MANRKRKAMLKLFSRHPKLPSVRPEKQAPPSTRARHRVLRRLQAGLMIGLIVGLALAGVILLGGLRQFESRLADLFYRPRSPSGQVVLVVIDDQTVDAYGWPIERVVHSGLLFAIMRARPKVIVLDFVLPEPQHPAEDEFLAMVIRRGDKIVQPVWGIEATRFSAWAGQFPAYDSVLMPASPLRTPNTTLAHTMIYPDPDGVTRRVPLAVDVPWVRYPAMGLAALALAQGDDLQVELRDRQVIWRNQRVPVDDNGQVLLNYVNRDAIKKISYADVTQGRADYDSLRDKIVLVGPATAAVHESYNVPLTVGNAPTANVEIQADLIETLLSGNFLREQDRAMLVAEVLLVAAIAGITLVHWRWLSAGALTLLCIAVYLLYVFQCFDSSIIVTPLYAGLALGLTYVLTQLYRHFSEERGRALIARVFVGMVSPETVNQVIALHERGTLSLTGGRRQVTVLRIGLRELAGLSEAMSPEMLIELLNRYTARVLEVVFRWGGSVNQVGNNIVVVWNLPLDQPDHAARAVRAAFEVVRQVAELHPVTSEERHVGVSIGIATGTAVAGRISVSARTDYTVVGEVVTLAERISALAGDDQVLISPTTFEQIHDEFDTREAHTIRVRGRKDPLVIRQVFDKVQVKTEW
jgi:adenylate cyclase